MELSEQVAQLERNKSLLQSSVNQLEAELADWHETSKIVLSEKCAIDERHCPCVPFLRKRIAELEAKKG